MLKKFIIRLLMFLNLGEGIIHLAVSIISLWGIYELAAWDWRILTAPVVDFFLGLVSLVTSYFLKEYSHDHTHCKKD
jgi:hypothetical protein